MPSEIPMPAVPSLSSADYNHGHPATLPIDPALMLPAPVAFADPAYFRAAPRLNADEVAHFKREGFLVKRGLVRDDGAFDAVLSHICLYIPKSCGLRRASEVAQGFDERIDWDSG